MSAAFDQFLKEYEATGREKADGYTLATLELLEPHEKIKAIQLLKSEVIRDSQGIDALVRLDPSAALNALQEIEKIREKSELDKSFEVYYWLWNITKNEFYAEKFCQCRIFLSKNKISPFYVMAKDAVESKTVEKMLREAIFIEPDSTGVSIAAGAILEKKGIHFDNKATRDMHRSMWMQLTEGSASEKKQILDHLALI